MQRVVGGFGLLQGLPGLGKVLLFEMEVGESYVDLGAAVFGVGGGFESLLCEGKGGFVVLLGLVEVVAAAVEVAQVEIGGDAGA